MKKTSLIIGGSRSGKSRHALELAENAGGRQIFIATCVPGDDEMEDRVSRHKAERGPAWETLEIPVGLPEAVSKNGADQTAVVLIDCLTLWISNLLMETDETQILEGHLNRLVDAIDAAQCQVLLVSNEVGAGIVPENKLARQFRDIAGFVNQRVAAAVDEVIWMVAGIPVAIKKAQGRS